MDKVAKELHNINETLEKVLKVPDKPENRAVRVLEFIILFAGALGVLNAIDIIRNWMIGGG